MLTKYESKLIKELNDCIEVLEDEELYNEEDHTYQEFVANRLTQTALILLNILRLLSLLVGMLLAFFALEILHM